MKNNKITAVVATYNGEKFIVEQLDSIRCQTVPVDEVLIGDDMSRDLTQDIVQMYITRHELENWKLIPNKANLGYKMNFFSLVETALRNGAEYIFLADQDDVWMHDKVEKMMHVMNTHNDTLIVASNVKPFYTSPNANHINFARLGSKKINKLDFAAYWLFTQRPGCSFLIKKELAEKVLNIMDKGYFQNEGFAHDCIFWAVGLLLNSAYLLNEDTLYFRRHGNNNSNNCKTTREIRLLSVHNEIKICNEMINLPADLLSVPFQYKTFLMKQKKVFKKRMDVLKHRSIFNFLRLLLMFTDLRYYPRKKNWLGDIFYSLRK